MITNIEFRDAELQSWTGGGMERKEHENHGELFGAVVEKSQHPGSAPMSTFLDRQFKGEN